MSRGSISHSYEYIPGYSNALQKINPVRIILKIRQQPIQARLSTNNERDRRPLDPPPIVQIELENSTLSETQDFLQNPYLFMSVTLIHSSAPGDIVNTTQNTLSGQTTSSMYKLKDINNQDGGFFVFGDLSVKLEGHFRLKFSIFEVTGLAVTNLKSIYSNVFQVYSSKTFPGMLESTFLSRSFSDQGVRIRIRKEHRVQISGSRKRKLSTSQDEILDLTEKRKNSISEKIIHPQSNPSPTMITPYPPSSNNYHRSPWQNSIDHVNDQQQRGGSISNVMSSTSENLQSPHPSQSIDRRTSIPFSPPHQTYDHYRPNSNHYPNGNNTHGEHIYYDKIHHPQRYYQQNHHRMMIPSPPPQSSLFKLSDNKRLTLEDKIPLRRQSADLQYHPPSAHLNLNVPRRMSLQQHQSRYVVPPPLCSTTFQSSNLSEEIIHLPPLRSIVPNGRLSPTKQNAQQAQHEGIIEVDAAVAMMQLASRRQQNETKNQLI